MTTKAERMTHWRLSRQLFKPEEESGAHATSAMQLRSPPPTTSLASPARSPGSLSILQEWHSPAALEEVFPWWTESECGGDSAASPVPVSSSSFPSPRTTTVVASAPPTASDALAASEARRAGPFHARVAVRVRPRPSSDARSTPAADATAVSFEPAARSSAASVEGGAGARVFLRASRWDADAYDADASFAPDASQRRVFEEVALDATRAALSGRRGVVIALGAAGGGKSHTLFGPTTTEAVAEGGVSLLRDDPTSDGFDSTSDRLVDSGADRGVVIRALETIFAAAEELEVSCGGEGVGECDGEGVGPSSTISARMTFVRVFRDGARDLFATGPARAFASPDVYPHACDRAGRDATAVDRLSARVASDLAGARAVSIPARSLPEAAAAIRDALRRRDALDRLEGDPGDVEGRRSHALLRVTIERTTTTEVRSNASENEPNASEATSRGPEATSRSRLSRVVGSILFAALASAPSDFSARDVANAAAEAARGVGGSRARDEYSPSGAASSTGGGRLPSGDDVLAAEHVRRDLAALAFRLAGGAVPRAGSGTRRTLVRLLRDDIPVSSASDETARGLSDLEVAHRPRVALLACVDPRASRLEQTRAALEMCAVAGKRARFASKKSPSRSLPAHPPAAGPATGPATVLSSPAAASIDRAYAALEEALAESAEMSRAANATASALETTKSRLADAERRAADAEAALEAERILRAATEAELRAASSRTFAAEVAAQAAVDAARREAASERSAEAEAREREEARWAAVAAAAAAERDELAEAALAERARRDAEADAADASRAAAEAAWALERAALVEALADADERNGGFTNGGSEMKASLSDASDRAAKAAAAAAGYATQARDAERRSMRAEVRLEREAVQAEARAAIQGERVRARRLVGDAAAALEDERARRRKADASREEDLRALRDAFESERLRSDRETSDVIETLREQIDEGREALSVADAEIARSRADADRAASDAAKKAREEASAEARDAFQTVAAAFDADAEALVARAEAAEAEAERLVALAEATRAGRERTAVAFAVSLSRFCAERDARGADAERFEEAFIMRTREEADHSRRRSEENDRARTERTESASAISSPASASDDARFVAALRTCDAESKRRDAVHAEFLTSCRTCADALRLTSLRARDVSGGFGEAGALEVRARATRVVAALAGGDAATRRALLDAGGVQTLLTALSEATSEDFSVATSPTAARHASIRLACARDAAGALANLAERGVSRGGVSRGVDAAARRLAVAGGALEVLGLFAGWAASSRPVTSASARLRGAARDAAACAARAVANLVPYADEDEPEAAFAAFVARGGVDVLAASARAGDARIQTHAARGLRRLAEARPAAVLETGALPALVAAAGRRLEAASSSGRGDDASARVAAAAREHAALAVCAVVAARAAEAAIACPGAAAVARVAAEEAGEGSELARAAEAALASVERERNGEEVEA